MTQEEIIKLAQEAGFENYAYEAVGVFERFARLVSAAEREKFTNTQEFVTLPREVVEQALESLLNEGNFRKLMKPLIEESIKQIKAALEQPDHSEQSYMGCVTSDMHELAEWLNTMYEDSKEQIAALEQSQNHVPDAGNMAPAGWKLVPVEPTDDMLYDIQEFSHILPPRGKRIWAHMLAAAPQPPAVKDSLTAQQPQVEQEPVAGVVIRDGLPCLLQDRHIKSTDHRVYTNPQPKREPLTDEQSRRIYDSATYAASLAVFMTRVDAEHPDADDKGVSGWLQEAEDRVKRRITEASHNIK